MSSATDNASPSTQQSEEVKEFWDWQKTQGYIVTGGGKLASHSSVFADFLPSDLPHYLIRERVTKQTLQRWKDAGRVSDLLVGCWARPIFAGGWKESSAHDTAAFNLQTPSLFIDMRFPVHAPGLQSIRAKGSLDACTDDELRVLARQHCFAGYSLLEHANINANVSHVTPTACALPIDTAPLFTRHHVIDWNYLSLCPRNRPNRWWVELSAERDAFKEHSFVRDRHGVPLYCERWARRAPLAGQREKYLAMRRVRPCPRSEEGRRRAGDRSLRDAVLVVVGEHFALAIDRYSREIDAFQQENRGELLAHCAGGGAAFVDHLLLPSEHTQQGEREQRRAVAQDYLDLEGSYGRIAQDGDGSWRVEKSTLPWAEQRSLVDAHSDAFAFEWHDDAHTRLKTVRWSSSSAAPARPACLGEWLVFENSFSERELRALFRVDRETSAAIRAKL